MNAHDPRRVLDTPASDCGLSILRFLRDTGVTPLLMSEFQEGDRLTRFGVERFLADSFLCLALEYMKGELRRTMTIHKIRFTKQDMGKHSVHITRDGPVVAEERVT